MKEFNVNLTGKPHQAHCLVLDLSDKSLVVGVLSSNKFGNEIFSVGLGDCV